MYILPTTIGGFAALYTLILAGCASSNPATPPPGDQQPKPPNDGADSATIDAGSNPDGTPDASNPASRGALWVLTGGGDRTIRSFSVDEASGELTERSVADVGANPSFLAMDGARATVYAVDESGDRLLAFRFDKLTGKLTANGTSVATQGGAPTHISLHPSGQWAFVANYTGGTTNVFPIRADATLGPASDKQSAGANAHQAVASPDGKFLFVPCLGANLVAQYGFNANTGMLTPNAAGPVRVPSGTGPRHMAFLPSQKFAYLLNELASTLTTFAYDATLGRLARLDTTTTLPAGSPANTGAEVLAHPNGRFVYTSNRGHDSIATFAVDATTGKATLVDHQKTGGKMPRSFALDPLGGLMFAGNLGSDSVTAFAIDSSGMPRPARVTSKSVAKPTFVGAFRVQ
jgi:6-phosphogluconolactonase